MALVRGTNRQWLASALWISAGVGALSLFMRHWQVSLRPADDWLAPIVSSVRAAEFFYGWVCIWIGIIPLITARRQMRMLALAAVATLAGAFLGSALAIACDVRLPSDDHDNAVVIGATLSALVFVGCVLISKTRRRRTTAVEDRSDAQLARHEAPAIRG